MSSNEENTTSTTTESCSERFGNTIDAGISNAFSKLGSFVGTRPKLTIFLSIVLTVVCGAGFVRWETESRGEELWVPQNTVAEREEETYLSYYPRTARFNQMIVQSSNRNDNNVLSKDILMETMKVHMQIEQGVAKVSSQDGVDDENATFLDLCAPAGGTCATHFPTPDSTSICNCLVESVLKQWNYNLTALEEDNDYMTTLQQYGSRKDLESVLGGAVFDDNTDMLVSAEALVLSYFLKDRSVEENGERSDPISASWEEQVFLNVAQEKIPANHNVLEVDYFAGRSFEDEFGGAIAVRLRYTDDLELCGQMAKLSFAMLTVSTFLGFTHNNFFKQGDLALVQVSYVVIFLFVGASMGKIKCGTGSRWTMSLATLVMIGLSTAASFGAAAAFGLFYGPVHSLLPFILLGIGVDDAFVIGMVLLDLRFTMLCVVIYVLFSCTQ